MIPLATESQSLPISVLGGLVLGASLLITVLWLWRLYQ
jgi:hypothetical protein